MRTVFEIELQSVQYVDATVAREIAHIAEAAIGAWAAATPARWDRPTTLRLRAVIGVDASTLHAQIGLILNPIRAHDAIEHAFISEGMKCKHVDAVFAGCRWDLMPDLRVEIGVPDADGADWPQLVEAWRGQSVAMVRALLAAAAHIAEASGPVD